VEQHVRGEGRLAALGVDGRDDPVQPAAERGRGVQAFGLAEQVALDLEPARARGGVDRPDLEEVAVLPGEEEPAADERRAGDPGRRDGAREPPDRAQRRSERRVRARSRRASNLCAKSTR